MPCTGDAFGGKAIELAGRVIDPDYQARGIGARMLEAFIATEPTQLITTYTRNPAIIKMVRRVSSGVYPLDDDNELREKALQMPHASAEGNAAYHLNRYGPEGLFHGFDPAERPLSAEGPKLKDVYPQLQSVRHALVIAANINQEKL